MVKKKSQRTSSSQRTRASSWHAGPLKGSFMITAILGLLISVYWVYPQSVNYGIAFMIIFIAMFIASLISMTKAPVIEV